MRRMRAENKEGNIFENQNQNCELFVCDLKRRPWAVGTEEIKITTMASSSSSTPAIKPTSISLLFIFIFSLSISSSSIASSNHHPCTPSPSPSPSSTTPEPKPWPLQFHSLLIVNTTTSKHEIIDLWYDWPKGRNFNIIQKQYGELLYDLEWTNGTSFYYTLDSNKTCRKKLFPVGILPPNWLKGATYVGQRKVDGFLCNVWEKAEFIRYFEDVVTKRPVHWLFINSARGIHVMTFEVGRVLEDAKWQAPVYCFNKKNSTTTTTQEGDDDIEHGSTSTSSSSDINDDEFNGGIFEWFRKAAALDN